MVTNAAEIIEDHFGKIVSMAWHQHDFLGLNLSFSKDKEIEVGMKEHLEKSLEDIR